MTPSASTITDPQSANPTPVINFVIVHNPLEPSDRSVGTRPWFADAPIAEYVEGLPEEIEWAVGVNGALIEPKQWAVTFLKPGDFLTLVPVPQGGGGGGAGKTILRVVGMIAIAVAAAYSGGLAASAMGFTETTAAGATVLTSTGMAIAGGIGAAVMVGGNMLPGRLLPRSMTA